MIKAGYIYPVLSDEVLIFHLNLKYFNLSFKS